jgi:glycosyltransferase involved in cell wall biosynthesis
MIMPSELFRPAFSPGDGIFQLHQLKAFRSKGYTAHVLSCGFISTRHLFKNLKCTDNSDETIIWLPALVPLRFFPDWIIRGLYLVLNIVGFIIYLRKNGRPDIIHAHNINYAGYCACKIGQLYNIKVLLTEHNTRWHLSSFRRKSFNRFNKAIKSATYVSTVGEATKKILEETFKREWVIIPNVCQLDIFKLNPKLPEHFELKKFKYWVGQKYKILLNVGGLRPVKQQETLIKKFYQLRLHENGYKLVIVGSGPLLNDLVKLVSSLNLDKSVLFLGERTQVEVNYLMANSHALLITSSIETFGVVAIEALASGCPVMTTKCGGPEQFIKVPDHGYIFRSNDLEDLDNGLELLEKLNLQPETLRVYVEEKFSNTAFIERFNKILEP